MNHGRKRTQTSSFCIFVDFLFRPWDENFTHLQLGRVTFYASRFTHQGSRFTFNRMPPKNCWRIAANNLSAKGAS
jgi:hypothetical protein